MTYKEVCVEYLQTILINYNNYLNLIFDNNQMLVAAITSMIMGVMIGILYKIPYLVDKLLNKYFITTITLESSCEAYHNLIDNLISKGSLLENSISYAIHTGRHGWGKTRLGRGVGAQIVIINSRLCRIYITREKMMDSFIYTMDITTFKYGSYEFAKWLHSLSSVTKSTKDTYTIKRRTKDGISTVYQKLTTDNSLVYTNPVKEIMRLMEIFTTSQEYYTKYHIPYKLGLLLNGVPGSGKTSIVKHLASRFGYDVAIITTISDLETLSEQPVDGERNLILLIEEIDMLLTTNRDNGACKESKESDTLSTLVNKSELATALSILDGVIETPGRVIIATTNKADALDKALKRPGRFDHTINFDYLTPEEFGLFTKLYYNEDMLPTEINQCTPVSLQQDFVSLTKDEFIAKNVKVV